MDNKKGGDDLFDRLNTSTLNEYLKELMDGLTAKVRNVSACLLGHSRDDAATLLFGQRPSGRVDPYAVFTCALGSS